MRWRLRRLINCARELRDWKSKEFEADWEKRVRELRLIIFIGQALRSWRQQDLPIPKRKNRVSIPSTQESPSYRMDRPLQTSTQEGNL